MASITTLIGLEFVKLLRRPMTWILTGIFLSFLAFMYFALTIAILASDVEGMEGFDAASLQEQMFLPNGLWFGNSLVIGVGAVIMVILAAGSFGSEFSWATVRTSLLMRAGRVPFVASKIIVVAIMAVVLAIVGMLAVLVGAVIAEAIAGDGGTSVGDHFTGGLLGDLVVITARTFVALGVWALIGGMLALATGSMAIGTGVGLAMYFIGDLMTTLIAQLGDIGEMVARLMPNYGINQLVLMNQSTPPEMTSGDMAWTVANLVGYIILFTGFGVYRFLRMDVLAKSSSG